MKYLSLYLIAGIFLHTGIFLPAQNSILGKLSMSSSDTIRLYGFNGFANYPVSKTVSDKEGNFSLPYNPQDIGMGYLMASDNQPFIVVLGNEDTRLKGEMLGLPGSITIEKGKENQDFSQYAAEQSSRQQALSAWDYLEKIYAQDPLFATQKMTGDMIRNEKQRIKKEDADFLSSLSKESYVSWYLPVRKLVSSVSTIAQYRPEEIPAAIEAFRKVDYSDARLYKSGLYKDILDGHFWLLEKSGKSLDDAYAEMATSLDAMIKTLSKDEAKLNEVTEYLFNLFEQHSLFTASEYLALKVLNDDECGCTIRPEIASKLEGYRAMRTGNTAPDLVFAGDITAKNREGKLPAKLSDIKSEYTLVVFAAGWCPHCVTEIPQIEPLYKKWKEKGLEVVLVSLDTDKTAFTDFTSAFSFVSVCDYKKWENQAVKDYFVTGTPSMYLLDKNRKIVLKPVSVKQMDAWMDLRS